MVKYPLKTLSEEFEELQLLKPAKFLSLQEFLDKWSNKELEYCLKCKREIKPHFRCVC